VLDATGAVISAASGGQRAPAVATGPNGEHLVAWLDSRTYSSTRTDIYASRTTSDGTVIDSAGFPVALTKVQERSPAVASNGSESVVVWRDERNRIENLDIWGVRVDAAGSVLDPSGIAITMAANIQEAPSVTSNGNDFFVVWDDYRNTVNPSDTVPGPPSDIFG